MLKLSDPSMMAVSMIINKNQVQNKRKMGITGVHQRYSRHWEKLENLVCVVEVGGGKRCRKILGSRKKGWDKVIKLPKLSYTEQERGSGQARRCCEEIAEMNESDGCLCQPGPDAPGAPARLPALWRSVIYLYCNGT